jgi:hypothetical protein
MKKEFIPYEQALALKELGFDEPCFVFWTNTPKYKGDNIQLCITDGMHGYSPDSISFKQDFLREGEVLAPLYQQAFDWFRKEHNLRSFVDTRVYDVDSPNQWIYDFQIKMGNGVDTQPFYSGDFDSYEEAEQACLDKLIEIVKNK